MTVDYEHLDNTVWLFVDGTEDPMAVAEHLRDLANEIEEPIFALIDEELGNE